MTYYVRSEHAEKKFKCGQNKEVQMWAEQLVGWELRIGMIVAFASR
jgi:hypothetical protein